MKTLSDKIIHGKVECIWDGEIGVNHVKEFINVIETKNFLKQKVFMPLQENNFQFCYRHTSRGKIDIMGKTKHNQKILKLKRRFGG